jgi:hypothetical protein
VATLPPEVPPLARRAVHWLLRLWLLAAILSLLSTAALGTHPLPRWAALASGAQKVSGLCVLGLVLLLLLSGVRAGLSQPRRQ